MNYFSLSCVYDGSLFNNPCTEIILSSNRIALRKGQVDNIFDNLKSTTYYPKAGADLGNFSQGKISAKILKPLVPFVSFDVNKQQISHSFHFNYN